MLSLTTTQRDLLCQLLVNEHPTSAAVLGEQLHLTPRQVQYGLREIKPWLSPRNLVLRHTPGVGVQLVGEPAQKRAMLAELNGQARLQLILTPDQRQQLLALRLLSASEPTILGQFQHDLAVSRVTVLKDLEVVEGWLRPFALEVARRQHRGCWVAGSELARRQALVALFWGGLPCERPLLHVGHGPRIVFALAEDAALLPIVAQVNRLLEEFDLVAAEAILADAEVSLGGQFAEEAFTWLTLAIAIQLRRVVEGQYVDRYAEALAWARAQVVWPVAAGLVERRWPPLAAPIRDAETATLAVQLSAAPRSELWDASLGRDPALHALLDELMGRIAAHYALPELVRDELLRAGLEAHILPASVRQRFALWAPAQAAGPHPERDAVERGLVAQLSAAVADAVGAALPADAEGELALLIRAALVRVRPERARRVLVVCPSGMATTQLLVARLRARLPRLGSFEVLPMRSLSP